MIVRRLGLMALTVVQLFEIAPSNMAFAQTSSGSMVPQNNVISVGQTQTKAEKYPLGSAHYVFVPILNIRAEASATAKILGALGQNDIVEIVDSLGADSIFVEVKIIKSGSVKLDAGVRAFVGAQYLTSKEQFDLESKEKASKYFVIQNVATETTRVYERCKPARAGEECDHRLVLEADMVVGRRKKEDGDSQRWFTQLGTYKITAWRKFHEDGSGHYPSWYDANYPAVPAPGASFRDWFDKSVMPNPKENSMRGAFGWFAAFVGPNSNEQWIHGTAGWGADGDKFVQVTRNFFVNMVKDARSSGCTRVENGLIAYLRDILPVGTEFSRIYAWEALRDPSLSSYASQREDSRFDYILTTESVRESGLTIEREAVLKRGVPRSKWLEEGSYSIDQFPTPRKYKTGILYLGAGTGALGNVYRLKKSEFRGVYVIDTGKLVNYQHPKSLKSGGTPGIVVPDYMISTDNTYTLEFDKE